MHACICGEDEGTCMRAFTCEEDEGATAGGVMSDTGPAAEPRPHPLSPRSVVCAHRRSWMPSHVSRQPPGPRTKARPMLPGRRGHPS